MRGVGGIEDWYICVEGRQHGPLTQREMLHLVALGRLKPAMLVWRPGFSSWVEASEVEGLYRPPPLPDTRRAANGSAHALEAASAEVGSTAAKPAEQVAGQDEELFDTALFEPAADMAGVIEDTAPDPELAEAGEAVSPAPAESPRSARGQHEQQETSGRKQRARDAVRAEAAREPAHADASSRPEAAARAAGDVAPPVAEQGEGANGALRLEAPEAKPPGEEEQELAAIARLLAEAEKDTEPLPPEEDEITLQVPADAEGRGARPVRPRARSYLRRHWQGDLSLVRSFWLNSATVLAALVLLLAYADRLTLRDATLGPALALISLALFAPVMVWMSVGLWRSAARTRSWSNLHFWPRLAQGWVIAVCLAYALVSYSVASAKLDLSRIAVLTQLGAPAESGVPGGSAPLDALAGLVTELAGSLTHLPFAALRAPVQSRPEDAGAPVVGRAPQEAAPTPVRAPEAGQAPDGTVAQTGSVQPIELARYVKPPHAAEEIISLRNSSQHPLRDISFVVAYKSERDEIIYFRTLRMRGPIAPGREATQAFAMPEGLREYAYAGDAGDGDPDKRYRVEISAIDYQIASN